METTLSHPAGMRVAITRRHLALSGLVGLLLAEVLVLTLRFDSQALVDAGFPLVGYARYLPQVLMVVAASALVFGGAGLASGTAGSPGSAPRRAWPLAYLAAHLGSFVALVALTGAVWEGPLGRSPRAAVWVSVWLATGLATLGFWLAAVLPANSWASLAKRFSGVILGALAVAAAACYAGRLTGTLLGPLGAATLGCVRAVLAVVFPGSACPTGGDVVGAGAFRVAVAPECSGFEGIGLIWVFLSAYLWFFRRTLRFPQALWLLPAGTLVIWAANVARIVALVAVGACVSPEVALGGFHSQAGWLAFNGVALGLVAVSRRARLFSADAGCPAPESGEAPAPSRATAVNPTAAYLAPLLALVAAVMVTTSMSAGAGFDGFYPARVVAVAAALWVFRRGYAGLRWSWSWPAVAVGAVVFVVWMALEPSHAGGPSAVAEGLGRLPRPLAAFWLAARVFGSVVSVPVAEELAFRGYLTRRLIAADFTAVPPGKFTWLSFVVSSCLFGALHQQTLIAGSLAGAFYALTLYRKGDLSEAVLAHATTNALIAAYVLATGSWSLWV